MNTDKSKMSPETLAFYKRQSLSHIVWGFNMSLGRCKRHDLVVDSATWDNSGETNKLTCKVGFWDKKSKSVTHYEDFTIDVGELDYDEVVPQTAINKLIRVVDTAPVVKINI